MTPWPTPMLFSAWGTAAGGEWEGSVAGLLELAQELNAKTIAVQLGQVTPAQVATLKAGRHTIVGWGPLAAGGRQKIDELKLDGLMPQVEGPSQLDGAVAALDENPAAGKPRAVVSTYGGLDDPSGAAWKRLADRGVGACFVECYAADGFPHADLDRMLWQGTQYRIPGGQLFPVVGVYRGEEPTDYAGLPGREPELSFYLAEMIGDAQATTWGAVTRPTATVAHWELWAGETLLHDELATSYPDGTTGLSRMLKWMGAHLPAIRSARSVELSKVLR